MIATASIEARFAQGEAFQFSAGGHLLEARPDVQAKGCWRVLLDGSDFASRLATDDAVTCTVSLALAATVGWTGP